MFRPSTKVSMNVLVLAVLTVGIGAFFAGLLFAGRERVEGNIASRVNEVFAHEENFAYEPEPYVDVTEPYKEPMGIAIYVLNPFSEQYEREALVRSMEDVLAAKHLLALEFLTGHTIEYSLYPDWLLYTVYIDDDARIDTPQEVFFRLERRVRMYVVHEIQSGETLVDVAEKWDMDLAELYRINDLSSEAEIYPGKIILAVTQGPLINVITIEELFGIEPFPREVEIVYVDTLDQNQTRIVQEGRDGYIGVIIRTTRLGTEIIDEAITPLGIFFESEPMIVEVGR